MEGLKDVLRAVSDGENIGKLTLLSDSQTNGEFLTHHFICRALQEKHTLCLVSFLHLFSHYSSIAAKLGVSLAKCRDEEQIVFVDCLTRLLSESQAQTSRIASSTTNQGTVVFSFGQSLSLRGLYQLLKCQVQELRTKKPDRPVCLVLDDLSVLISLGVRTEEVISFVGYCGRLLIKVGYVVCMVHCDDDSEDEDEQLLRLHLLHHCHLHLHAEGLKTGRSRDIHGELLVERRDPGARDPAKAHSCTTSRSQYRVLDRGVHLFAKGTSRAVL